MKTLIMTLTCVAFVSCSSVGRDIASKNTDRDKLIKKVVLAKGESIEIVYGKYEGIRPCGYYNSSTDICVNEDESRSSRKKYSFEKLAGVNCEAGEFSRQQTPIQGGGAIRFNTGMSREEYSFYSQKVDEYRHAQYGMQYHQKALKSGEIHLISHEQTGDITAISCK